MFVCLCVRVSAGRSEARADTTHSSSVLAHVGVFWNARHS